MDKEFVELQRTVIKLQAILFCTIQELATDFNDATNKIEGRMMNLSKSLQQQGDCSDAKIVEEAANEIKTGLF